MNNFVPLFCARVNLILFSRLKLLFHWGQLFAWKLRPTRSNASSSLYSWKHTTHFDGDESEIKVFVSDSEQIGQESDRFFDFESLTDWGIVKHSQPQKTFPPRLSPSTGSGHFISAQNDILFSTSASCFPERLWSPWQGLNVLSSSCDTEQNNFSLNTCCNFQSLSFARFIHFDSSCTLGSTLAILHLLRSRLYCVQVKSTNSVTL